MVAIVGGPEWVSSASKGPTKPTEEVQSRRKRVKKAGGGVKSRSIRTNRQGDVAGCSTGVGQSALAAGLVASAR